MTVLQLEERWAWAGTSLSTYAHLVQRMTGADTLPPKRGDDVLVPSRTGRVRAAKLYDSRRVALTVWVSHLDADGVPTLAAAIQARANLDALEGLFARTPAAILQRTMPDGTTRSATAEVVSCEVGEYPVGREGFPVVVDFLLADPWFYGADLVVGPTALPATPTDQVVTHPGNVPAERLVFDLVGPASNPRITNQANGWYLEALVTVAAGDHLILDTWAATAENEGVNAIGSVRHSGGPGWFRLEPGANTLRVTGASLGGTLTTTVEPPYTS